MYRFHKCVAVVGWTLAILLFVMSAFEAPTEERYDFQAVGVLMALIAATFTLLAALETIVSRVFAREAALSRQALAQAVAVALADEMRRQGTPPTLKRVH